VNECDVVVCARHATRHDRVSTGGRACIEGNSVIRPIFKGEYQRACEVANAFTRGERVEGGGERWQWASEQEALVVCRNAQPLGGDVTCTTRTGGQIIVVQVGAGSGCEIAAHQCCTDIDGDADVFAVVSTRGLGDGDAFTGNQIA